MSLGDVPPSNTYMDSSASSHKGNSEVMMTKHSRYIRANKAILGDGFLAAIQNTGSSTIPTSATPLLLKNVLWVLSLA